MSVRRFQPSDDGESGRTAATLWLVAIPAAWATHLGVAYTLTVLRCEEGFLDGEVLGVAAIRFALLGVTLAAGAIASLALVRLHRRNSGSEHDDKAFAAHVGTLLAAILLAYLLWTLVPTLVDPPCS